MTEPSLIEAGLQTADMDLLGALVRGALSALAVAALLLAARRWGRDLAGLLAGLPTVTGPAMVWLALDRGHDFAGLAAQGAVMAAVPCALFALTYACLAFRHARLSALFWACAACLLSLLALSSWYGPLLLTLALVAITCTVCLAFMPRAAGGAQPRAAVPVDRNTALRAGVMTVLVSGAVSAAASLSAQVLGPQWAGVLTSPPLLAAAVVLELHRQGCPARVQDFLRGYTTGLVGRSVFVAVFGALLVPKGLATALTAALAVALLLGWSSLAWMQWRSRLATVRPPAS
jgi:hypothetical protein